MKSAARPKISLDATNEQITETALEVRAST